MQPVDTMEQIGKRVFDGGEAVKEGPRGRDSLFLMANLRVKGIGETLSVRVRNLSPGGLMAELPDPVVPDCAVEVEVRDSGIVTTFCVVNIPGLSDLAPEIPYVSAQVLLDGANNTFFGLIRGCEVDEVRKTRDPIDHLAEHLEASTQPDNAAAAADVDV